MIKLLSVVVALGSMGISSPALAEAPLTVGAAANSSVAMQEAELALIGRARKAFGTYLAAWSSLEAQSRALSKVLTEDAVFEFRIARPDWSFKIEGEDAVVAHLGNLNAAASNWTFSNVHYFPTLDRNVVFVQYDARFTRTASGQVELQKHVSSIEMKDERIAHVREFADSRWILDSLTGERHPRNATQASTP